MSDLRLTVRDLFRRTNATMKPQLIAIVQKEYLGPNWIKRPVDDMRMDDGQLRKDRPTSGLWYHMATYRNTNVYMFVQDGGYTTLTNNLDLSEANTFVDLSQPLPDPNAQYPIVNDNQGAAGTRVGL